MPTRLIDTGLISCDLGLLHRPPAPIRVPPVAGHVRLHMQHDMQLKSGCFFVRVQYSKVLYTAKHAHTKIRGGTGNWAAYNKPKAPRPVTDPIDAAGEARKAPFWSWTAWACPACPVRDSRDRYTGVA